MASISGFKLSGVTPEEFVYCEDSKEGFSFIFGKLLYCNNLIGRFKRQRNIPEYLIKHLDTMPFTPTYMALTDADIYFTWNPFVGHNEMEQLCQNAIGNVESENQPQICVLINCLLNLDVIQGLWLKDGQPKIQCVWNNRAYRIYGLDNSCAFEPFSDGIKQEAKLFAVDFGPARISYFEREDDFDLLNASELLTGKGLVCE